MNPFIRLLLIGLIVTSSGPLKGTRLPQIPAIHTTWQDWIHQYPESKLFEISDN
ncbi:MAG: DUF3179 domain-containing protein [Gammaproteobacteria bacterium]|nr:DUF3179 domain-containing protein [Gammaproteobacteria bacterium]MBT4491927.1 DUF3179 domain-containing protein [Gammaproteobacteria bacterium]